MIDRQEVEALREYARRRRVAVYVNTRAMHRGEPPVELKSRGTTLGCFHTVEAARQWLQPGGRHQ